MDLDFSALILAHSRWKSKLKSAIENQEKVDVAVVGRDDQCDLGKWLYGEGKKYAHLPEYTDLKNKHSKFHSLIPKVIEQSHASREKALEMLSVGSGEFAMATSDCINAISSLRKAVGGS
jgi:hypothetical protein